MKQIQSDQSRKKFLALAFLLPFLGYSLVMLVSRFSPFGNSSILYSDMYHQYYPFFVEFRRVLRSGGSLVYNWSLGLGVDYLGLIAYYLASPLNLLSVLVPEGMLLGFFSMLVPVKLGLAGLFFGVFLDGIFHQRNWSTVLFSCSYALCAWALGYQWNIMWLDTFALLPLVILGMVNLLRKRRFFLYTIALFFSIASNYYIGFFTCIFVALCFFAYEICYGQSFRRFLGDLGAMFLFSLLAVAMTAFLEWPAYVGLGTTNSSVNAFPTTFSLNIASEASITGLLEAMRKVAGNTTGGLEPTFKEGLPNLYCGILPLMFLVQFFASKQVRLREKLCTLGILIFFMLSFILRQLDYIWHGFHFTNMIPYRFSFLFSFVVLVMGYRGYELEKRPRWRVALSMVCFLGLAACSDQRLDPVFLAYNLSFCVLYGGLLLAEKHPKKVQIEEEDGPTVQIIPLTDKETQRNRLTAQALLGVMALELAASVVVFGIHFGGTDISNYPHGKEDAARVVEHMKQLEADSPYYRAECTHTQTLNDDALNGYNGITMFSSSVNVSVTKFMAALGYGAKPTYNRYSFEEASPVAALFLNLKYMISRNGKVLDSDLFQPVYNLGNVTLLENTAYLPLGFLTREDLATLSVDDPSAGSFQFLNLLFQSATSLETPVYQQVDQYHASSDTESIAISQRAASGYCSYTSEADTGDVSISFTVPKGGEVCLDLSASKRNSLTVYKNGESLLTETMSLDQMLSLGQCASGDEIEVAFRCKANETGRLEITAAVLDGAVFQEGVRFLQQSPLEIQSMTDTFLTGTVEVPASSLLYTSIPSNGNWHVTVDGVKTEPVIICGVMMGLRLTPGWHTITFSYHHPALQQGMIVSLASLAVFLGLTALTYLPRRKGKFQNR